jgi:PAS domain S-box-containing protein
VQGVVVQAVRELLENAYEHAGVSSATVSLGTCETEGTSAAEAPPKALHVEVRDTGSGFDVAAAQTPRVGVPPGGLQVIRQRLRLVGARLEIDSRPGQGTRAVIWGPGAASDADRSDDDPASPVSARRSGLPAWNLDPAEALEQQFREALQALGIVVFRQDRELRYIWICSPIPGFEPEEVLGKRDEDLMQRPEEARAKAEVKREVMRTGTGTRQTFSITADGTTRYFDYAIEPWRAPDGSVIGVTCAALETQQDRAETQNG